jgi:hypothetical protein
MEDSPFAPKISLTRFERKTLTNPTRLKKERAFFPHGSES